MWQNALLWLRRAAAQLSVPADDYPPALAAHLGMTDEQLGDEILRRAAEDHLARQRLAGSRDKWAVFRAWFPDAPRRRSARNKISPPGGYVGGVQITTDVAIDPAGNVWVANNWDRPDEGLTPKLVDLTNLGL